MGKIRDVLSYINFCLCVATPGIPAPSRSDAPRIALRGQKFARTTTGKNASPLGLSGV